MSKQNKVNKNSYVQDGRLTPDEMARERVKQGETTGRAGSKENVIGMVRSSRGGSESTQDRTAREEEE